jgi:acyl-coenzyme A synthetase/AMP-(fatty) acid ligase
VGGCVVLDQSPDAFKKFFDHPVTFSLLIPSQLKDLVQWTDKSRVPSDEFVLGITAGFLPLELAEQAVRQLTRNVFVSYGSSELGIPLMVSHFKAKDDLYWLAPVSGQLIQIVDDDGNECATGQEGELRVRPTEIDCTSYVDDEEATSQVFRDGFFYPGDMAIRRPDGRIRILGRTGDVLNVQGIKIAAAPLEFAIQRELRVDEVCLFSRLDGDGNEELAVAIQSDQPLSRSQLDAVVRMLPPFPRVRFAMRKEFPRTETGTRKTQRTILRKLIFAEEKRSD